MPSGNDGALHWALRPATRPDAGAGHVSRCAALGAALAGHSPVVAVVETGGEAWIERFNQAGIAVVREAELGQRRFAGVVLDDYDFKANDVARWRVRTDGPVAQIDDFGRPLPGIDVVINATAGLSGSTLGGVPALVGASFIMLQPPYCGRPKPKIRDRVERVVVSIGWYDPRGATERVLAALGHVAGGEIRVDVMMGSVSPNAAHVAAIIRACPNWHLHVDLAQPWFLLEGADVAISGAGQTLLERLAFGIPTLALAVVDNQVPAFAGVIGAGAAYDLGRLDAQVEDRIEAAFRTFACNVDLRARLSAAAQRLVDGRGATRVARHLAGLAGMTAHKPARAAH